MKKIILLVLSLFLFISSLKADGVAVNASIQEYAPNSKSAILIEPTTKTILYEKNAYEKLSPASMTKIMTMLLTAEALKSGKLKLDDEVLISKNASSMGGTQIFIEENTKVKVSDLLKGIGIASANDAAVAIAEKIGGTEENFVNMMNSKAKELGAKDTNFKNPHGLDEVDHYTTAYDLALIASELVKYDNILKITSTYEEYINVSGENHWLVNTNTLVRFYDGMDGLKTGYTDQAKYCLTSTMKKNNMRLVGVVMGAESKEKRSADTISMMEYGFGTYKAKTILEKEKKLETIYINNSKDRTIPYYLEQDINILTNFQDDEIKYDLKENIFNVKAPLKKGDIIGEMILSYNNKKFGYNLVVNKDVKKSSFLTMLINNLKDILSGEINIF